MSADDFDYVLLGGGLANGLLALALFDERPAARVALIEQSGSLGGNHTWSFHETDLRNEERRLLTPLVRRSWPAQDVFFPSFARRMDTGYSACDSPALDREVRARFSREDSCELLVATSAERVDRGAVRLLDGRVLRGRVVFDGRGIASSPSSAAHRGGYQKFVGLELELDEPAPSDVPVLMDARVDQIDGYRFMYVLPFGATRVLFEDTYYSLSPRLDRDEIRGRILEFARARGYRVARVAREEHGVLPIPTHATPPQPGGAFDIGMRAGWFHPTTGYSLPFAARFAIRAARCPVDELPSLVADFSRAHERRARFARFLNRLLFGAFASTNRRHVLERFYRLPDDVIARFYALETTTMDRAHILCGRPPQGFSVSQMLWGDRTV